MDIASYFPLWSKGGDEPPIEPGASRKRTEPAKKGDEHGPDAGQVVLHIRRPPRPQGKGEPTVVSVTVYIEPKEGDRLVAKGVLPYHEKEGIGSGDLTFRTHDDELDEGFGRVLHVEVDNPKRWSVEGGG